MAATLREGITQSQLAEVYSSPRVAAVGHDHRPAAPIDHPLAVYLSAWIGDKFAGAFLVIKQTPIDWDLHAMLLPHSISHSRALGRECIKWAFDHPIERVTANIIEGLESAVNYCIKLGFVPEGRKRLACVQNGLLRDIYILGMTRDDWNKL